MFDGRDYTRLTMTGSRRQNALTAVHLVALVFVSVTAFAPRSASAQAARELSAPWPTTGPSDELPAPPTVDTLPSAPSSDVIGAEAPLVHPVEIVQPTRGAGRGIPVEAINSATASDELPAMVPPPPSPPNIPGFGTGLHVRATTATRLRALDTDLQVLAARGGGGIIDGVLQLVMGGVLIGLGTLVNSDAAPYMYTYGGTAVARGVLSFAFLNDPSGVASTYAHMPMTNADEIQARLAFGERELESLANNARIARILDGSLSVASGLLVVPIYLGPRDFSVSSPMDYFLIIGAGISVVSGVVTLITTSEAERRWSAYEELRTRMRALDGRTDAEEGEAPLGNVSPGVQVQAGLTGVALTF